LAAIAVLGSVLFTSGCILPAPTRPLAHEPISITVVNDRISWVQCLGQEVEVYYVSTSLREQTGQQREWALLTAEGAKDRPVAVPSGEAVDLSKSFQGLPVIESNDIRVSSLEGDVTVYLVLAGPDTRVEMAFRNIDSASLAEVRYVYYSGEVSDEPCGMERE